MKDKGMILNSMYDVHKLLRKERSIYLYGAGKIASFLLDELSEEECKKIVKVLVSEKINKKRIHGIHINNFFSEPIAQDAIIIVAVSTIFQKEIVKVLSTNTYRYVLLSLDFERELLFDSKMALQGEIDRRLWRVTTHNKIKNLTVNINYNCNLNCKYCDHFAPLAGDEYISADIWKDDFWQLSTILPHEIENFWIMGGEPLLHPELQEIIGIVRKNYPSSGICILTNGTLLLKMSKDFWKSCRDNKVIIQVTKYPVGYEYEKAKEKAEIEDVAYTYYSGGKMIKTLYHEPLDLDGLQDSAMNYMHCSLVGECVTFAEGKIWPCTISCCMKVFNRYFQKNIPVTTDDYIDIYKITDKREIFRRLSEPFPICAYCDVDNRTYNHAWEISKKSIEEWT